MTETTTGPLDYAPPPPPSTRGRRVRRIAAAIVLTLLIVVAWVWRGWIIQKANHAALLYAQQQCLRYDPPPSQIVYEEDPERARELLKSKDYRSGARPHAPDEQIAMRDSTLLDPIYKRAPWSAPSVRGALLFMHERFNEHGERFLLIVHAWVSDEGGGDPYPEGLLTFSMHEVRPAGWNTGFGGGNGLVTPISGLEELRRGNRLRMYAGQSDPNDPTHFTIRYEIDGVEGYLDGWEGERTVGPDGVPIPGLRLELRKPK